MPSSRTRTQKNNSNPKQATSARAPKQAPATSADDAKAARKPRTEQTPRGLAAKPSLSALDAAQRALAGLSAGEAARGLTTAELVERMRRARLWSSPSGKTPEATLYSAMIREITARGAESRFKRIAPGRFAATRRGRSIEVSAKKTAPALAPRARAGSAAKPALDNKRPGAGKTRSAGAAA